MNYKDKEAFEKWFKDFYEVDFNAGNARFMGQLISWQAAIEYERFNHKYCVVGSLDKLCEKLEAENKKLREALESISKDYDRPSDMMKKAREALKETNDK